MGDVPGLATMVSLFQLILLATGTTSMDQKIQDSSVCVSSPLDCNAVQFYLATRNYANGAVGACLEQTTTLFNGTLDVSKPTKILVHGWKNSRKTEFTTNVTRGYLNASDVNVIQVDWSAVAMNDYFVARTYVPAVGKTIAAFIERIVQELQVEFRDLHLVGHSLGAHIVGIAGYQFQSPNKIKTVTGFDPAGFLFWTTGSDGSITKESGEFVVILHTCEGLIGTTKELGHADFYPNGGVNVQPGCGIDTQRRCGNLTSDEEIAHNEGYCSHDRALYLYSASLVNPTAFDATECSSYKSYLLGLCKSNRHAYLGDDVDRNARGKYYFKTSSSYPFTLS